MRLGMKRRAGPVSPEREPRRPRLDDPGAEPPGNEEVTSGGSAKRPSEPGAPRSAFPDPGAASKRGRPEEAPWRPYASESLAEGGGLELAFRDGM